MRSSFTTALVSAIVSLARASRYASEICGRASGAVTHAASDKTSATHPKQARQQIASLVASVRRQTRFVGCDLRTRTAHVCDHCRICRWLLQGFMRLLQLHQPSSQTTGFISGAEPTTLIRPHQLCLCENVSLHRILKLLVRHARGEIQFRVQRVELEMIMMHTMAARRTRPAVADRPKIIHPLLRPAERGNRCRSLSSVYSGSSTVAGRMP